jgi:hypothetical protein
MPLGTFTQGSVLCRGSLRVTSTCLQRTYLSPSRVQFISPIRVGLIAALVKLVPVKNVLCGV